MTDHRRTTTAILDALVDDGLIDGYEPAPEPLFDCFDCGTPLGRPHRRFCGGNTTFDTHVERAGIR